MLVSFTLPYAATKDENKEDTLQKLIRVTGDKSLKIENIYSYQQYEGPIEKVVKEFPGATVEREVGATALNAVLLALNEIAERMGVYSQEQQFNGKCEVHVPGFGLLMVDEIGVWENACTDTLQRALDDGWRIVAVCPQPNQRRPDYVLGRTK